MNTSTLRGSEMTYDDQWDEDDFCEHDFPDIDILTGEWYCSRCGELRAATQDEIEAEIEFHRQYAEHEEREHRREFWRKLTLPIRWAIFRTLERIWPRKSISVLTDDEIPF